MTRFLRGAIFPLLMVLGGCASVHTGEEIKSTFDAGVAAYDAKNYEQAFALFHSIDEEDVAAMRNEGLMLRQGLGTGKDPKAAQEMLARAASAGLATAAYDLAEMLMNGEAGPPDPKAAFPWLTQAASAHHPIAEYKLGQIYEEGTVAPKNMEFARALYADAATAGVPGAKERLAKLAAPVPGAQPALNP